MTYATNETTGTVYFEIEDYRITGIIKSGFITTNYHHSNCAVINSIDERRMIFDAKVKKSICQGWDDNGKLKRNKIENELSPKSLIELIMNNHICGALHEYELA